MPTFDPGNLTFGQAVLIFSSLEKEKDKHREWLIRHGRPEMSQGSRGKRVPYKGWLMWMYLFDVLPDEMAARLRTQGLDICKDGRPIRGDFDAWGLPGFRRVAGEKELKQEFINFLVNVIVLAGDIEPETEDTNARNIDIQYWHPFPIWIAHNGSTNLITFSDLEEHANALRCDYPADFPPKVWNTTSEQEGYKPMVPAAVAGPSEAPHNQTARFPEDFPRPISPSLFPTNESGHRTADPDPVFNDNRPLPRADETKDDIHTASAPNQCTRPREESCDRNSAQILSPYSNSEKNDSGSLSQSGYPRPNSRNLARSPNPEAHTSNQHLSPAVKRRRLDSSSPQSFSSTNIDSVGVGTPNSPQFTIPPVGPATPAAFEETGPMQSTYEDAHLSDSHDAASILNTTIRSSLMFSDTLVAAKNGKLREDALDFGYTASGNASIGSSDVVPQGPLTFGIPSTQNHFEEAPHSFQTENSIAADDEEMSESDEYVSPAPRMSHANSAEIAGVIEPENESSSDSEMADAGYRSEDDSSLSSSWHGEEAHDGVSTDGDTADDEREEGTDSSDEDDSGSSDEFGAQATDYDPYEEPDVLMGHEATYGPRQGSNIGESPPGELDSFFGSSGDDRDDDDVVYSTNNIDDFIKQSQ